MSAIIDGFRILCAPKDARCLFRERMTRQEKAKILSALESIDSSKRSDISSQASHILGYLAELQGVDEVIKGLAIININNSFVFNRVVNCVGNGLNSGRDLAIIMGTIACFPEEKWAYLEKASNLFHRDMTLEERLLIANEIAQMESEDLLSQAEKLTDGLKNGEEIASILKALREIPDLSREYIVYSAEGNIKKHMSAKERIEWLHLEEIARFHTYGIPFYNDGMSVHEKIQIIRAIHPIESFIARGWIDDKMSVQDRVLILNAIKDLPKDDREDICNEGRNYIHERMSVADRVLILNAVKDLPKDDRKDICHRGRNYIDERMSAADRILMLSAVKELAREERRDAYYAFSQLIREDMSVQERLLILNAVKDLPKDQRDDICNRAGNYIDERMSAADRVLILNATREQAREERWNIYWASKKLIQETMGAQDIVLILNAVNALPNETRDAICRKASIFILDSMSAADRVLILNAPIVFPHEMQSLISLIDATMNAQDRLRILNIAAQINADQLNCVISNLKLLVRDELSMAERENIFTAIRSISITLNRDLAKMISQSHDPIKNLQKLSNNPQHLQNLDSVLFLLRGSAFLDDGNIQILIDDPDFTEIFTYIPDTDKEKFIKDLFENRNQKDYLKRIRQEMMLAKILVKFDKLGQIELPEIALVLAAKKADSVYVVPEITDLVKYIDLLCEKPTKDPIHRFQFVRRAGGHSFFGEVVIDKSKAPPHVTIFVCDPMGKHSKWVNPHFANAFRATVPIEFFTPEESVGLQKGIGCSYFSLDGALMLREQEKYDDIYRSPIKSMDLTATTKVHYISLPTRMKRASQHYEEAIVPILDSAEIVNKNGQSAAESIKKNLKEEKNKSGQDRIFNLRVERKMGNYKEKVRRHLEINDDLSGTQKHTLQGLADYCDRQIL